MTTKDEANHKRSDNNKKDSALKDFFLKVIVPAFFIILIVNILFRNSENDNPSEIIKKALDSHNYETAFNQYKKLIEKDFNNLEHHRGYLKAQYELPTYEDMDTEQKSDVVKSKYEKYSSDTNPKISDIGYYGLGYFHSIRSEFKEALKYYNDINDKQLSFVNNSIGYIYLKLNNTEKAKEYLLREIENNGYIEGACQNLAKVLYNQRDFEGLDKLISDESKAKYIPKYIFRITQLKQGNYFKYILAAFDYDYVTFTGFLAALMILITWFFYLKRLDVFEPEKYRYMLTVLIGSMFFSGTCTFLYDFYDIGFKFDLNGNLFNDLIYCIFGIGLIEETVKIIPFLLMLKFSKQINESIDYVIYAALSALGFAFMENLIYFRDPGLIAISARAMSSVLGHMSMTVFAMYGIFYSKYKKNNRHKLLYFIYSFTIAMVVHGMFDFWLLAEGLPSATVAFSFVILLFSVIAFSNIIRNALNNSEFNDDKKSMVERHSRYLVYSLSGILLLQYVLMALKFGADNTNMPMFGLSIVSFILMLIIVSRLGKIEINQFKWVGIFDKKRKKKKSKTA